MRVADEPTTASSTTSTHVGNSRTLILLGTCTVRVRGCGPNAQPQMARALIDSGAQDCFITSSLAQRLGLPLRRCDVSVAGLGQNVVNDVGGVTSCTVQPRDSDGPVFNVQPIVMSKITSKLPAVELPSAVRSNYKHLVLADQHFDKPADVDLLLGAELFHNIYDGQRLEVGPGLPVALHSVFGWVLTGKVESSRPPPVTSSLFASTLSLGDVVKSYSEIEEPLLVKTNNYEDSCEKLDSELFIHDPGRNLVVPILKEPHKSLGDSCNPGPSPSDDIKERLNVKESLLDSSLLMKPVSELDNFTAGRYVIPHSTKTIDDLSTFRNNLTEPLACPKLELLKLVELQDECCNLQESCGEELFQNLKFLGSKFEPPDNSLSHTLTDSKLSLIKRAVGLLSAFLRRYLAESFASAGKHPASDLVTVQGWLGRNCSSRSSLSMAFKIRAFVLRIIEILFSTTKLVICIIIVVFSDHIKSNLI